MKTLFITGAARRIGKSIVEHFHTEGWNIILHYRSSEEAAKKINIQVPLVVRLAGTNFEKGKEILDKSGLKILSASDLNDAAKKIVNAVK